MQPWDAGSQRHVDGAVDGDAVVEVHRVPHPAEGALADTLDLPVVLVDAARGVRDAALAAPQWLGAVLVAHLAGADRDLLAPLLAGAARHVRDQRRAVTDEEHDDLLRQVHLGVVGVGAERAARLDVDGALQALPHLVRHDTRGRGARRTEHELLERPHGGSGELAELAVGGTRREAEVGQALLHQPHVVAGGTDPQRRTEVRRGRRGDRRRDGGRGDAWRVMRQRRWRAARSGSWSWSPAPRLHRSSVRPARRRRRCRAAPRRRQRAGSGARPDVRDGGSIGSRGSSRAASTARCPPRPGQGCSAACGCSRRRSPRSDHISRMIVTMMLGDASVDSPRVRGK